MASQSDLVKIAMEGFALIDEYYPRKSRAHRIPPPTPPPPPPPIANFRQQQLVLCNHRYQPQEPCTGYPPKESKTVRVTKAAGAAFAPEAATTTTTTTTTRGISSYVHYEAAVAKSLENMVVKEYYQRPSFLYSLVEIGMEAFAILEEESRGRTTRPPPPPPRQERQQPQPNRIQQPFWPYRRSNMQFVSNTTHNPTTPPTKENGAMDCNQAARTFCGVLIDEAVKRKPLLNPRRG
ncbi:hypothetical protein ACH5RR_031075 [Cinchona calisaya]|uniref:Uncharacterized protein n=1 Tax=Cinchona calisaya TaxID=153742 RepID=A0ABD2YE53_9GENT